MKSAMLPLQHLRGLTVVIPCELCTVALALKIVWGYSRQHSCSDASALRRGLPEPAVMRALCAAVPPKCLKRKLAIWKPAQLRAVPSTVRPVLGALESAVGIEFRFVAVLDSGFIITAMRYQRYRHRIVRLWEQGYVKALIQAVVLSVAIVSS